MPNDQSGDVNWTNICCRCIVYIILLYTDISKQKQNFLHQKPEVNIKFLEFTEFGTFNQVNMSGGSR